MPKPWNSKAFPDFRFTIEDIVAESDKVVVRSTGKGTHEGGFIGIPATNRKVTYTAINLRIAGGKLVEEWSNDVATFSLSCILYDAG